MAKPIDYKSFKPKGSEEKAEAVADRRWWKLAPDDAARSIAETVKTLQEAQQARLKQDIISARLYGNLSLMGTTATSHARLLAMQAAVRDRVTYGLVQSVIDTVTAKVAENKPRPYFLTNGGDHKVQRKAKKLNQFTDGLFYECKANDLRVDAFRDGCIWGDGVVHVFPKNQRVAMERVLRGELYVDEIEAMYGNPRQMHRVKAVDRQVLLEMFPDKAKQIEAANKATEQDSPAQPNVADLVTVRESWHLKSGPEASDGKRILTIDGAALTEMDDWKHDFFPFVFLPWCKRPVGFWSQGLAEQLQNIQLEVNKILWLIQRSMHLAGTFKVFLENGSKIVKEHINNDIGAIVNYTGTKPEFFVPGVVPIEYYQHLETLIRRGYEQGGVSMMAAAARKPEGLNSGKAIREYKDETSERFRTVGRYNDQFALDLARVSIATAKDIAEENGGHYEVTVPGKKFLKSMDWADIDLEDDEYVMQCFPVSSLPTDPAGRLQTVQEYIQAGLLSPRQGKRLLDFPDLERVDSLQSAAEDWLTEILERMVDDGEYTPPEPFDDLQLARELALEFYAQGKTQNLAEKRLELLRRFLAQLDALEAAAMPDPMAMAAGMAPQADPMAAPTSDLVPNVPGMGGAPLQ